MLINGLALNYFHPCTDLDRPLRIQEAEDIRISGQSAYKRGNEFSPTYRPPLLLIMYL